MKIFAVVMCVCLVACNEPAAVIQANQAQIQSDIVSACSVVNNAMTLAAPFAAIPQVGALLLYGKAACFGTEAVAALVTKALADPNTVAWTQNLAKTIANSHS